jgi:hypothetical protein
MLLVLPSCSRKIGRTFSGQVVVVLDLVGLNRLPIPTRNHLKRRRLRHRGSLQKLFEPENGTNWSFHIPEEVSSTFGKSRLNEWLSGFYNITL